MIKRFKERIFFVFKKLQIEFYNYVDVRRDKTSRLYVQNIFRHVKIVEYISKYHQFTTIWNNFEFDFRFQISKSIVIITFFIFLKQLNVKKKTFFWHKSLNNVTSIITILILNSIITSNSIDQINKIENVKMILINNFSSSIFLILTMFDRHRVTIFINTKILFIKINQIINFDRKSTFINKKLSFSFQFCQQ